MSQCLLCSRDARSDSNYCDLHDQSGGGGGEMDHVGPMGDAGDVDGDVDDLDDDFDNDDADAEPRDE